MRFFGAGLSLLAALLCASPASADGPGAQLSGRVLDENSVAVPGAKLQLSAPHLPELLSTTTDAAGRFMLPDLPAGDYRLKVEKPGFYAYVASSFEVRASSPPIEIVLNHLHEFEETVNVVYSAPVIDPQETAAQQTLGNKEIVDLPYPATHDFRSALSLIPGVVKDNAGRIHMGGGDDSQASYSLDGFNVANPVTGVMQSGVSVDALRGIRIETSRYSAEFGKGSAGMMALETTRGDDHFRFSATNFFPSFEFHDRLSLSAWTPRATVSGPIARGRAWFFNALDLQYDLNIIDQLPPSGNTNRNWHGGNLTRVQVNLSPRNILTSGFLVNFTNSRHLGLTPYDPVETSRDLHSRFYIINLKDQMYFEGGWVLEVGAALNRSNERQRPLGDDPYVIGPRARSGNYFLRSSAEVERIQVLANVLVRPLEWRGRHDIKFGMDGNRIGYQQSSSRGPIHILREDGTRSRLIEFSGDTESGRDNSEFSAYAQDRWSPTERLVLEAGLRMDWDQVLRDPLLSPRFALTYAPRRFEDAKFSAGAGVFYDVTKLEVLNRSLDQARTDTFFAPDGIGIQLGPLRTRYRVDEKTLRAPFYLNWSLGWEQKLPGAIYFSSTFIRKHGRRGWAYDVAGRHVEPGLETIDYRLTHNRRDSYYYVEVTGRRMFREKYYCLVSYARSSARSSAVVDFSLENTVFGRQGSGPLPWDAPNRFISWGLLPVPRYPRLALSYFLEWRSGQPFTVVNESQSMVGNPNSRRYPDYFGLNLHLERRFRFWRSEWALRAGFNNITGHKNPTAVINNIDSPYFGSFAGGSGRAFTGRIRFLGRN
ncbi:MAG: TonB-dependent receptor [Acidobacteriota bacterium]